MASTEERMRILMMIQEGKISAAEGAQLIEALDELHEPSAPTASTSKSVASGRKPHYLRVLITDTDTGKSRANIRIPLSVIGAASKFGASFIPDIEGLDNQELSSAIHRGEVGKIIDVYDDDDGEHVEVFIE